MNYSTMTNKKKFTFVIYTLHELNKELQREDKECYSRDQVFSFAKSLLRHCDNLDRSDLEDWMFDTDPEPIVVLGKDIKVLARRRTKIDRVYQVLKEEIDSYCIDYSY